MKAFFPTCTATLLLAAASIVQAASSTDLTVKGMITPSACSPALSNGGSLDFGKISSSDLRKDRPTYLPRQTLQMTVTCEGATMMALEAKDNREGTESSNDYYNFGLGLINGTERLGYLTISPMNRVADGVGVSGIVSWDGGTTWEREPMIVDNGLYRRPLGLIDSDTGNAADHRPVCLGGNRSDAKPDLGQRGEHGRLRDHHSQILVRRKGVAALAFQPSPASVHRP